MKPNDLTGSWVLVSFDLEDSSGARKPWGSDVKGVLIYTNGGRMSVGINKTREATTDGEAQDTLDAMLFYAGRYSIEDTTIRHQVEIASDPERVGKELLRHAKLQGSLLELTSPPQSFGRSILVWRKEQS